MNQLSRRRDKPPCRRLYYRIDDEVIIKYRELPEGSDDRQLDEKQSQTETAFLVCSRLAEYRRRMQPLLSQIRSESPATARVLGLFEEKTDLLADLILQENIDSMAEYRSKVQLSAGGIAFRTHKEFLNDTKIFIEMILFPSLVGLSTEGRVIRSKQYLREVCGCRYETTVEFVNMKEPTRDLIAKHVLEKKTEQLRRARQ